MCFNNRNTTEGTDRARSAQSGVHRVGRTQSQECWPVPSEYLSAESLSRGFLSLGLFFNYLATCLGISWCLRVTVILSNGYFTNYVCLVEFSACCVHRLLPNIYKMLLKVVLYIRIIISFLLIKLTSYEKKTWTLQNYLLKSTKKLTWYSPKIITSNLVYLNFCVCIQKNIRNFAI